MPPAASASGFTDSRRNIRQRRASASVRLLLAALLPAAVARGGPIVVSVNVLEPGEPVTPYEYGMFIEPIGNLMARSLWAEMLDDRKFYDPIVATGQDAAAPISVEGPPGITYRKWRPLGGDTVVKMDTHAPFVGAHSPCVAVDGASPRGLGQTGLGIAKGRRYTGHVVLRGDAGASIEATLAWGATLADRASARMPVPGPAWREASFEFTAGADSTEARFEITGVGSGTFCIGAVSLMPTDNVNGWRADTTAILRTLHSGFWRLPGGNFLSGWDWHGAIGPRDRRAPIFDHAWNSTQSNDLGMDEFMELTRLIGVQPYVTVNAGLGDAHSAAEEVDYLNGPSDSEWGAKRAANGHTAPYNVKFWNIGNEPYGWWQIGKTSIDYFMMKHNDFAAAMRAVDPSMTIIGSGAMPDQMHARDARENASLESIQPRFGTEADWTGGLLAQAFGTFDGVSEHWYDRAEKRPDAPAANELIEFVRSPSNQVRMKAEEWRIYQQRFPAMRDRHVFLSIDEYAYIGAPANLKLALAYSMVLQEMLRHTDFIKMAAFTMGVSTLDITPTGAVLNTNGEVFKLYGEHFGAGTLPLVVDGDSPQPGPAFPVGFDHPQVRAGSPTYPLDVIAALSPDRQTLKIAIINATLQTQLLVLRVDGGRVHGSGSVWVLTGEHPEAQNVVGQSPQVSVSERKLRALPQTLAVPPISTSIYEFPIALRR